MDQSLRDRLSSYAVERRDPTGRWVRAGLFGSARDAADNVDVLVAMHGGKLSVYGFTRVGVRTWIAVVGWSALALMVAATVAGLIVLGSTDGAGLPQQ